MAFKYLIKIEYLAVVLGKYFKYFDILTATCAWRKGTSSGQLFSNTLYVFFEPT